VAFRRVLHDDIKRERGPVLGAETHWDADLENVPTEPSPAGAMAWPTLIKPEDLTPAG